MHRGKGKRARPPTPAGREKLGGSKGGGAPLASPPCYTEGMLADGH